MRPANRLATKTDSGSGLTVQAYSTKIDKTKTIDVNINELLTGTTIFSVIMIPLTAFMSFWAGIGSASVAGTVAASLLITKLVNYRKRNRFKGLRAQLVDDETKANQVKEEIQRSNKETQDLLASIQKSKISRDSLALLEKLTSSVSNLLEERLPVEQEHEVKRILLDASNVIKMTMSLSKYDAGIANLKLKKSLEQLNQEAQVIVEQQKTQLVNQIDSYQSYMEIRSR